MDDAALDKYETVPADYMKSQKELLYKLQYKTKVGDPVVKEGDLVKTEDDNVLKDGNYVLDGGINLVVKDGAIDESQLGEGVTVVTDYSSDGTIVLNQNGENKTFKLENGQFVLQKNVTREEGENVVDNTTKLIANNDQHFDENTKTYKYKKLGIY
jgi:hypothetical protein